MSHDRPTADDLQLIQDVTGETLDAPPLSEEWADEQEAARKRAAEWLAKQPPEVQERERLLQEQEVQGRADRKRRILESLNLPEDTEGDVHAQAMG